MVSKHPKADLYMADRDNGMTYAEIAKKHGVSKQAVNCACSRRKVDKFRRWDDKRCIYPNVRKWLNDNRLTMAEFVRRMELVPYGNLVYKYSCYLRGDCYPQKATIDKMLEVTGLTYEKFWEVDDGK